MARLNDIPRGLANIARAAGGAASRRVHDSRHATFGTFRWWKPARKHALNDVGYEFLHAKRVVDAIVAFQLSADLFPASWNALDSFGEAPRAQGMTAAAIASDRRSLTLNRGTLAHVTRSARNGRRRAATV